MTSLGDDQLTIGGERWSLGRLIGKGGFASVYEAVASGSGLQAAVKVVDLSQQSTWAQSKLCTEAENLLRAQTHANIIQLYGEARHGQYHLFVMERWGRDLLESVLEHRGLGELCTQHVMVQVLRALSWLHEKRICHGCAAALRCRRRRLLRRLGRCPRIVRLPCLMRCPRPRLRLDPLGLRHRRHRRLRP